MADWKSDLLSWIDDLKDPELIFDKVKRAAEELGFERVAFGLQMQWPLAQPKVYTRSSYPVEWDERYMRLRYYETDPTVLHGHRSLAPVVWHDELFVEVPQFWEEARGFGLKVGWTQSCMSPNGIKTLLSLARSAEPLTDKELRAKELEMRWIVNVAHLALGRALTPQFDGARPFNLSCREIEVLKWTADGKTSGEIASIMALSMDTVNYHVKNAVTKMGVANKTAAAVRAAMWGML